MAWRPSMECSPCNLAPASWPRFAMTLRVSRLRRLGQALRGTGRHAWSGWFPLRRGPRNLASQPPVWVYYERAPAVLVSSAGEISKERVLAPASASGVQTLVNDAVLGRLPTDPDVLDVQLSVPRVAQPGESFPLRLLHRIAQGGAPTLERYRALGGYRGLRKALELGPEGTLRELFTSGLQGRGGAAFPTAAKWEALFLQRPRLQEEPGHQHYVICNADESEPGTFKDRILMEGDPFAVLEGLTIGGLVTGAREGYIYLRGEYPLAAQRMAASHRLGHRKRLPRQQHCGKRPALQCRNPPRRWRIHLRRRDRTV